MLRWIQTACPIRVTRVTGAPVPEATNMGKSRVPQAGANTGDL